MNPSENRSSKRERSKYVERNMELLKILSAWHDSVCYELASTTYEKIVKHLEEEGENTAGLLIKLERGINLGLIEHDGGSGLKDGNYFLSEKGKDLHIAKERSIRKDMRKKIREERKKKKRTTKRIEYIS